ncbi:MAG: type II and III secretion system protein family protein [Acidithiobacillus sp.]
MAARTTGRQVVLSGNASTGELKRLNLAIRAYPGVVNLVRPDTVAMKRMVVLDVQVVDFSKNALDNLGINWQTSIVGPAVGLVGDFVNNSLYRLGDVTQGGQAGNALNGPQGGLSGLPLNVPPFSSYAGIVSSITSQINLAVQNGQAYILANPRLVTRSGGTATFLAGGEVPIPVSAGFGAVSVTYKNYGVKLKIQPDVDHQGNILATVNTAISQINPALTVQGYPAFLTRKTDSVVNVHSGQTIVLSGLIHATGANSINKLPWLGDIPILGTLFRDTQFQHNQSELVIFVTPEVINPNSPVNRAMIRQGRQDITRFNRDFQHGYFVPGIGHDPNKVGYPNFTSHVAPTAAPESAQP